jgi:hypothetical protein
VLKINIEDVDGNEYDAIQIPLKQVHRWRDVKTFLADKEIQDDLFITRVESLHDNLHHEMDNNDIIPPDAGTKFILAICYLYSIK